MKRAIIILLPGLALVTATTFADINKCTDDNGVAHFSDLPDSADATIAYRSQSIDDLIEQATPYTPSIMDEDVISEELIAHTRKIAPGEWIVDPKKGLER